MFNLKVQQWTHRGWLMLCALALAACPAAAFAQQAQSHSPLPAPAPAQNSTEAASTDSVPKAEYLRVVEQKGKTIALEIASRNYTRADGTGPTIALVGVAHIGDKSFYRAVDKFLENYDVVLYESVKPPGTGGAGGETDAERVESTKAAMQFVGGLIESHRAQTEAYPTDIKSLEAFAAAKDVRLAKFLNDAMVDAWGKPLVYETIVDDATGLGSYTLMSLGADGQVGGDGIDSEIHLADQHPPDPMLLSDDDGLQAQLADALGLRFQLDSLAYDEPNWRCSDMAMDELNRRLTAKNLDFNMIGGTLAGSSMPAKIIKFLLGFMKMADTFMEGAIADTFKVVMIEMLGDPTVLEQGLSQLGRGFSEVIVEDRNQVVIDDLKAIIEREPEVNSVAVLYGAAHMPDMAKRLADQLGYAPASADEEWWITAIKVDLTQSKVSQANLDMIRSTMKRSLRQQMRQR